MDCFKLVVTFLSGFVFAILCSGAGFFMWQAIVQFESKATSFKRAEIKVDFFPTYSFCLDPPNLAYEEWGPPYDYILGRDFNLSYYANGSWFLITSVGQKYNENSHETVYLEEIATNVMCYKINSTSTVWLGSVRGVKINFHDSFPEEDLPAMMRYYLTSEHNAYSITFNARMNGNFLKYNSPTGHWIMLSIKSEKFVYLKETSGCTDLSFWELWEPYYSSHPSFKNCPKKCAAISLPQNR